MPVCVSDCSLPLMTSHFCLLILSGLTASSQLGLEDVFFSPQDQTVSEGEAVFLQCVSGESSPPANITWLKNGTVVTKGRQIQGEYGGGHQKKTSATLHLLNVTLEDDGIYICVTHNALMNFSKKSNPAKLTVQGVPRRLQIIQGPDNITVAVGTEVSIRCAVHGFPVPMVHWFKDGCQLTNCSASFSLQNNGQLLTFRNVTRDDEGSYHCEASNQEETIKSPPAFLHPAEMDWSFVQQPVNMTVKRGENVTLICRPPSSRPAALVSWFRNNQLLTLTTHTTVQPSGDLSFHSVQEDDSGSYFCRASNIQLQRFLTSQTATLTVLAPPEVKLWPQTLTVPVGARVVLECQVSGHPKPSITWVKRGHSRQTGGKITSGVRNATLYIQSARSYDEGVYVCEASNTMGQSRSTAVLRVAVSPVIVTFVGQVNCMLKTSVVLPCRAMGIQPITYTWTREDTQSPITPTEHRVIDADGALHISSVQHSDAGEYYCTAENRAGRHQRRTLLTITDHPADRSKQRGVVLSATTIVSKGPPVFQLSDSLAEQHLRTKHPYAQAQHSSHIRASSFPPFSGKDVAELRMPSGSLSHALRHRQNRTTTTSPTQPLITQMQPPILPPPPHPNFQSVDLYSRLAPNTQPPVINSPRSVVTGEDSSSTFQPPHAESQSHLILTSLGLQTQQQTSEKFFTEADSHSKSVSQITESSSTLPVDGPFSFHKVDSYIMSTKQSTVSNTSMGHSVLDTTQDESYPSKVEERSFSPSNHDTSLIQSPHTQETHLLPFAPSSQASQTHAQQPFTLRLIPKFHLEFSTIQHHLPSINPTQSSITKPQPSKGHRLLSSTSSSSALPRTRRTSSPTQTSRLSFSTTHSPDETSTSSTLPTEITHQVNGSDQLNVTRKGRPIQSAKSANDTELTDWLKRNTSQSPMTSNDPRVTQQSPSWLPVLEKHDIPIVVGVGVSLAFIFVTVSFYSVVQKNEPAPTSRAAQRHLGVPKRHSDRWTAGRTYENRAFEDDECVAVIEQSPNTSDTRARPPGPTLVTVQMEPTFEDHHKEIQATLDNHSVTVETHPEPTADAKIDPVLEEQKGCSLSQPSIQLHCAEDWGSNRGEDHSPCHDTLPPPSSLPSRSPSPSPPSRREEGLHSSLTLHSAEPCVAPIHHSLSISRGNPPLLLSHHVSMGLTTVAVDVHFYPAATASMAVGSSTRISSASNSTSMTAPLFSPPLVSNQENDQSTTRFQSSK